MFESKKPVDFKTWDLTNCATRCNYSNYPNDTSFEPFEVIILAVTTPVDQRLIPDMSLVELAMKDLRPHLSGGETILLRATVFPGTCQMIEEKLAKPPICGNGQNGHGLLSVGVSFCPERLASGHVVEELQKMPQIVSGSTPRALSHALALFEPLSVDLVELSLLEAEVATLFLNAWRYVSFGTANQFYHIAVSKGFWDFFVLGLSPLWMWESAMYFILSYVFNFSPSS